MVHVNAPPPAHATDILPQRQEDAEGALGITLQDGVLTDQSGWTGYVADNSQLQFDNPPQAGALYTAGFSVCSNGHLAIGDDDTWYKCLSGTFFNIYLDNILDAGQCTEVYIQVTRLDGSGSASSASVTTTRTSTTSSMSMAGNSTMIMSSSGAASNGTTATTRRTGAGTATTRTGAGASTATSETPTRGSSQQTGGSGAGSQGGSSSSVGAAGLPTARADVFGMAVGLLAMAAL